MPEFMKGAAAPSIETELFGVKYVDGATNDDWFRAVSNYNATHPLLWAVEPKLQIFPMSGPS